MDGNMAYSAWKADMPSQIEKGKQKTSKTLINMPFIRGRRGSVSGSQTNSDRKLNWWLQL